MEEKKGAVIQSLQNGLALLELIAKQNRPLKFTHILQLTTMTKSNVHKYVHTLTQAGYLQKQEHTNTYALGTKLEELVNRATNYASIVQAAAPHMEHFTKETGLTTLLAIPTSDGPKIVETWQVVYGIDIGAQTGTIMPIQSSTGLICYTFCPHDALENWINIYRDEIPKILKETNKIKKEHVAFKKEPLVEHISSCSVPVLSPTGELIAAITVVGFKHFIPQQKSDYIVEEMQRIAEKISRNLF